jgi:sterol desaturase/sphingolipid hydroxylase (fatty acid hydroxylase superfamily)
LLLEFFGYAVLIIIFGAATICCILAEKKKEVKRQVKEKENYGLYKRLIGYSVLELLLYWLTQFVYFANLTLRYDTMTLSEFLGNSIWAAMGIVLVVACIDFVYSWED